jgi:hypothetical protein
VVMKMRIATLATAAALAVAGLFGARPAQADASAVELLRPFVERARSQAFGPGTYGLRVSVVTSQPDLGWVSYVEGPGGAGADLVFTASHWVWVAGSGWTLAPAEYSGVGSQSFSDRRFNWPTDPGPFLASYPFNPFARDEVGIRINVDDGSLTWRLNSWGGGESRADLTAFNGVLLGALGGSTVLVSVRETFQAPLH